MADQTTNYVGKAYAFFYCRGSKDQVLQELPKVRSLSKTPSDLELSLIKGMQNVKGNGSLMDLAKEAQEDGCNYMMQASYPIRSYNRANANEAAAKELNAILINLYASNLYKHRESFSGGIAYEVDGKYHYM